MDDELKNLETENARLDSAIKELEIRLKKFELENKSELQSAARLDSAVKELDIKLKEFELANKPGFWKSVFASPAFLAAIIAVFATAGTATVSVIVAQQQRKVDLARSQLQANLERDRHEDALISGVVTSSGSACDKAAQLTHYLRALVFTSGPKRQTMQRMRDNLNAAGSCGYGPV